MAQFNADVLLRLLTTDVEKQIKKVEKQLEGVKRAAESISVGGKGFGRAVSSITKQLAPLDKALNNVGSRVRDVVKTFDGLGKATVGIAGLNALGGALSGLSAKFGGAVGALRDFGTNLAHVTSPINVVTDAIQSMGVQGVATAGGIAAATAALMAFSPVIKRAATGAKDFADSFNFEFPKDFEGVSLSAKTLRDALKASKAEQQSVNASTSEYRRLTVEVLGLQRELNQELRRQEDVLNRVNAQQVRIADNVRKNIRASQASRGVSGFAEFSAGAGAQTAIDKSIRRQKQKIEKAMGDLQRKFGDAPLMLPSSEMLNASGRGIKQLSSYYGDLNTQIDAGVQAGQAFTSQLNTQASKAQGLPPIFSQVQRSLEGVATSTATGNRVQQSWNVALAQGNKWRREDAVTTAGIDRITKEILDKDYARIQAQKQLNKLKGEEQAAAKGRKAFGGRLSSAAIGGAFPLLFGQSGLAAAGGAIGGLLGGAGGGFAGSLVGTLIGDLINVRREIDELAKEMGLGAQDAKLLGEAFRQAGADADKFQAAVQNIRGVGFVQEDEIEAIRLASKLADDYKGKVDKITQAYAGIASSGKAGLADINKFTAQGIPILQQLEKNLGVNRKQLLQLAKDGKISAQQVSDALIDIANKSREESQKSYTAWDKAWRGIGESTRRLFEAIKILLKPFVDDIKRVVTKIAEYFNKLYAHLVDGAIRASAAIANAFAGIIEGFAGFLRGANSIPGVEWFMGGDGLAQDAARMEAAAKSMRSGAEALKGALTPKAFDPLDDIDLPGLQDGGGGGGGGADKAKDALERSLALTTELQNQVELLTARDELEEQLRKIEQERLANLKRISQLENQDQAGLQVSLTNRVAQLQVEEAYAEASKKVLKNLYEEGQLQDQRVVRIRELTTAFEAMKTVADGVGIAFKESFTAVINGTQSAQEAIANFFKQIGQALLDYATTAIANYIAIGIARIFAGVGSTSVSGTDWGSMGTSQFSGGFGVDSSGLAGPSSSLSSSLDYAGVKFAEGGYVTRPTKAVIGEAGESEYVIPASKMDGAMSRYAAGRRGSSVIPGANSADGGGGAQVIRFESTVINNVEYVTRGQAEAMSRQAAKQGAAGGYAKTIGGLRNSRATRARVGMG